MVGMHMGDDQGANALERELDELVIGSCTAWRCLGALEEPAVDQHAAVLRDMQLVAGTGNAILGAMMGDAGVLHRLIP